MMLVLVVGITTLPFASDPELAGLVAELQLLAELIC
jgi:hypothetical protein